MKLYRLYMLEKMVIVSLILLFFCIGVNAKEQICEMTFTSCPDDFRDSTIMVPPEVIAISSNIFACDWLDVIEGIIDSGGPPSIVFIIDHSFSMMGLGNTHPGNDIYGSRFNVTRDLIDTIYSIHPTAEVGLVVFREVLYFDHRNNGLFVPLPGQGDQSYLPLLQLNTRYQGNQTGLQALRNILKTDTIVGYNQKYQLNVECVDLAYKPQFSTVGNTNINNAFAAALEAMKTAKNPAGRQFIIFLSDGEPFPLGDPSQHGGKDPFYFQQGLNTPTTFTVYLHNTETEAPLSLQQMTENIQDNGYSSSNKASDIWVLKTDYDALMSLFMKYVITPMMTVTTGYPTSMVVNNVISTTMANNEFIFSDRFPLLGDTTRFDMKISYHLKNLRTTVEFDTNIVFSFNVARRAGAVLPDGISMNCWDKGELSLYYNGQPVFQIHENMPRLEVRFDPGTTLYDRVMVELTNKEGTTRDLETLNLVFNSSYWAEDFPRNIASAVRNDNILQHQMLDSVIVTYRNPKLPLDTLRVAVPFRVSNTLSFPVATYNDRNADGFIDSIFIGIGGTFSPEDFAMLAGHITLPQYRNFSIDSIVYASGGIVYYVKEGSAVPQTSITDRDVIGVKQGILPRGGVIESGTITVQDNVPPVIINAQLITNGTGKDSIRVIFSEPISPFTASRPFRFRVPGGVEYEVYLDPDGVLQSDTYTARVRSTVPENRYLSQQDSIWINTDSKIQDLAGNAQLDPLNRRELLTVKQTPYLVVPEVINNPYTPGTSIPEPVKNAYKRAGVSVPRGGGITVVVKPTESVLRPGVVLSGTASVYDVVKNPVIENVKMVFDNEFKCLYFIWNGCNSNGRKVATGTYIASMQITDNQGKKETKTTRIGVKR